MMRKNLKPVFSALIVAGAMFLNGCATPTEQMSTAVNAGDLQGLDKAIAAGASMDLALSQAVNWRKTNVVQALLAKGADPNKTSYTVYDIDGPIRAVNAENGAAWELQEESDSEFTTKIVRMRRVGEEAWSDDMNSEWLTAAKQGKTYYSYRVKIVPELGPLHLAIRNADPSLVEMLLKAGASPKQEAALSRFDTGIQDPFFSNDLIINAVISQGGFAGSQIRYGNGPVVLSGGIVCEAGNWKSPILPQHASRASAITYAKNLENEAKDPTRKQRLKEICALLASFDKGTEKLHQ